MKKLLFCFIWVSILGFAQKMPDISDVWKNKGAYYKGTISQDNMPINLKIEDAKQDPDDDHNYWVTGFSTVENHTVKFKGKITIHRFKKETNTQEFLNENLNLLWISTKIKINLKMPKTNIL